MSTRPTVGVLGGLGPAATVDFMALVYRIKAGERGPALTAAMAALADALAAQGAEALIAACTEIPLVLAQHDAPLPLFVSTDLLVARTLAFAGITQHAGDARERCCTMARLQGRPLQVLFY